MVTFDNFWEAYKFSSENEGTPVRLVALYDDGSVYLKCYYNGNLHGAYINFNSDGSIRSRNFCISNKRIDFNGLSEIQLQGIFGECYENF